MKNRSLFIAWASLFILCAIGGFIPVTKTTVRILLTGLSLLFFLSRHCFFIGERLRSGIWCGT